MIRIGGGHPTQTSTGGLSSRLGRGPVRRLREGRATGPAKDLRNHRGISSPRRHYRESDGFGSVSMAISRPNAGLGDLRTLFEVGSFVGMSDAQLLERYVTGRGGN